MTKKMNHVEISIKGGETTLKRKGKKHFQTIGKLGAKARWEKKPAKKA